MAGQIDRSSDRIALHHQAQLRPLQQIRRTPHHHSSRTLGILLNPIAESPDNLTNRGADKLEQADQADPATQDLRTRESAHAQGPLHDHRAQALLGWPSSPLSKRARLPTLLPVWANLFGQPP